MLWTIFLVGMFGTFGLNFPIVLTAMAKSTFGGNASMYGLFNIALAIGSAAGALFAGAAARPGTRAIVLSAAAFGLLQTAAAFAPDLAVFLVLLGAMGLVNLAFQSMANASVQARRGSPAARPRDGAVHAGLHRRYAHRRAAHRRADEPFRRAGRHGRMRCGTGAGRRRRGGGAHPARGRPERTLCRGRLGYACTQSAIAIRERIDRAADADRGQARCEGTSSSA